MPVGHPQGAAGGAQPADEPADRNDQPAVKPAPAAADNGGAAHAGTQPGEYVELHGALLTGHGE